MPVSGYRDRAEAGEILAEHVRRRLGLPADGVVLALPRGGVPVAARVARALGAPLDVCVVRKLGLPGHEEYAIGALGPGGVEVLDRRGPEAFGLVPAQLAAVIAREKAELVRREQRYRGGRPPVSVRGRTAIVVDDGLATGFTMRAALAALRGQRPRQLVVAVPVGAADTCAALAAEVDVLVCPLQPEDFRAVGLWYRDFAQTTDDEVRAWLGAETTDPAER